MTEPYYQDKWVTIYHGDCREILPQLPDGSVGLMLTSPPYNIGLNYGSTFIDHLAENDWHIFSEEWLGQAFRVAANSCRLYVAVSEKMLWWLKPMLEDIGWSYSQLFVWCKSNFVAGTRRISGEWNAMTDWIIIARKGDKTPMLRWNETNTFNWFVCATPQSNFNEGRFGPAQLPLALVKRLISRTPGEVILDPFLGTGSVMVAAKYHNRHCIGIEIEEKYCEIAANRCRQSVLEFAP